MLRGIAPGGAHLYLVSPYTSYARMKPGGCCRPARLPRNAPAVAGRQPGHDLKLPYARAAASACGSSPFCAAAPPSPSTPPTRRSPAASTSPRGRATAANATLTATSPAPPTFAVARRRAQPKRHNCIPNINVGPRRPRLVGRRHRVVPRIRLHLLLPLGRRHHGRGAREHGDARPRQGGGVTRPPSRRRRPRLLARGVTARHASLNLPLHRGSCR